MFIKYIKLNWPAALFASLIAAIFFITGHGYWWEIISFPIVYLLVGYAFTFLKLNRVRSDCEKHD